MNIGTLWRISAHAAELEARIEALSDLLSRARDTLFECGLRDEIDRALGGEENATNFRETIGDLVHAISQVMTDAQLDTIPHGAGCSIRELLIDITNGRPSRYHHA